MILTEAELAAIRRQAEAEYPAECCGVVLVHRVSGERRVFPCRNIQDERHAEDPETFPRTSRTAYYMDPRDTHRFTDMDKDGYTLWVIYHSHIDADAYFSETDKLRALGPDGQPNYPTANYVVVSVKTGRAGDAKAFRWEAGRPDFVEMPFDGTPHSSRQLSG